jgi:hypothetical protein
MLDNIAYLQTKFQFENIHIDQSHIDEIINIQTHGAPQSGVDKTFERLHIEQIQNTISCVSTAPNRPTRSDG